MNLGPAATTAYAREQSFLQRGRARGRVDRLRGQDCALSLHLPCLLRKRAGMRHCVQNVRWSVQRRSGEALRMDGRLPQWINVSSKHVPYTGASHSCLLAAQLRSSCEAARIAGAP
jgi:hypothetical protein